MIYCRQSLSLATASQVRSGLATWLSCRLTERGGPASNKARWVPRFSASKKGSTVGMMLSNLAVLSSAECASSRAEPAQGEVALLHVADAHRETFKAHKAAFSKRILRPFGQDQGVVCRKTRWCVRFVHCPVLNWSFWGALTFQTCACRH